MSFTVPHFSEMLEVLTFLDHTHEVFVGGGVGVGALVLHTELLSVQKPASQSLVDVVWVTD